MSVPLGSCRDHDAEAWALTEEPGQRLLAEVIKVLEPRPADITRWRKLAAPRFVAAALRLAACRARAQEKFSRADQMWLDPVGLEQATSEAVSRHKAGRFDCRLVVDLCAGIGGDSVALAQKAEVLAVDADRGMCRRLAWNAGIYEVADRILPCQSRAETCAIPPGAWIHLDPDRRASGPERARRLAKYTPGLAFLRGVVRLAPGGAIKLSPASDFAAHFRGTSFEVELISLGGECKEATIWFGAAANCRFRATRLPENVTWTDRDGGRGESLRAPVVSVSTFLYDPDPALLRSGLLDSFALAHGLSRISTDIDYLTGDRLVNTPFLTPFEVQSVHRLDMKQLRRLVAGHNLGPLEIKVRGLDLAPEMLRTQLHVRGSHPATLILAGGAGPARAILAIRPSTAL
jgi:THUMP domain-like/RNA cap guanine-N2 methyltransferase